MKQSKWFSKMRSHRMVALVIIVVSSLVVIAIAQTLWLGQLSGESIQDEYAKTSIEVGRISANELKKYAPIIESLMELGKDNDITMVTAKLALQKIAHQAASIESPIPLIKSVALADNSDTQNISVLKANGQWQSQTRPGYSFINDVNSQLSEDSPLAMRTDDFTGRDYLVARTGKDGIAIVGIDLDEYFDLYIAPVIEDSFPAAKIEWLESVPESPRIRGSDKLFHGREGSRPQQIFPFHGFSSKLRLDFSVPLALGVPHFGEPDMEDADHVRLPEREHNQADEPDVTNQVAVELRVRYGEMQLPRDSIVARLEQRFFLSWLLTIISLAGIGVAFSLAMLQIQKLRTVNSHAREFVATVTHELRTPVTAITTAAYNMRSGLVSSEHIARYSDLIYSQSTRLSKMIEEMLLFSTIENKSAGPASMVDIERDEYFAGLRQPLDEIAKSVGIALEWKVEGLPAQFTGDPEGLGLVVSNLVMNSINHAYSDGKKGEIRVLAAIRNNAFIRISVEDDGRGISKSEAALVFEPFYRDRESRERQEKGSGLGLFIAQRIAQIQGGTLVLECPYKKDDASKSSGCRFVLDIPFKEPRSV